MEPLDHEDLSSSENNNNNDPVVIDGQSDREFRVKPEFMPVINYGVGDKTVFSYEEVGSFTIVF